MIEDGKVREAEFTLYVLKIIYDTVFKPGPAYWLFNTVAPVVDVRVKKTDPIEVLAHTFK